jgi:hypothetical protein
VAGKWRLRQRIMIILLIKKWLMRRYVVSCSVLCKWYCDIMNKNIFYLQEPFTLRLDLDENEDTDTEVGIIMEAVLYI